jgi:hypothetical protein
MLNSFDPFFNETKELFLNFSWRRLLYLISIIIIIFFTCVSYEWYTKQFELSKLERCTQILKNLQEIDKNGFSEDSMKNAHDQILSRLNIVLLPKSQMFSINPNVVKIVFAILPWFLFSLIFIFDKSGNTKIPGLIGTSLFAVLSGLVGMLIPIFMWPWGNIIIYPWLVFLITVITVTKWHKLKLGKK